ncbi:MAG: PQQ-binding-like beta-propeller repeat protein [Planctomycetes bacterium]|nr:PQQ-binding-like beta-propeller repeat protein [Planctomycetota bacterium]
MFTRRRLASLLACLLAMTCAHAGEKSERPSWPQFHGPNRDNISTETGLLKKWPDSGPPLVWKYGECGEGFACVSIADGMIFTSGDFEDQEMILALSMDGELLWKSPNGPCWDGPYPGSRATPTYDKGVLYHLSSTGRLAAFDAKEGKEKWAVDLPFTFGARHGTWAFAENVIVEGDRVFCVPGGSKGFVVALKKRNGKPAWVNTDLDERAGYCSPIIVKYKGARQLITLTQKSVIGVDIKRGRLLWVHPHVTPMDQNVTQPIFHRGYVFVTSAHLAGGEVLKLGRGRKGVTEVWSDKDLDNCHGGVILLDGRLYGSACKAGGKAFFCVDFQTGKIIQTDKKIEKLSLTCAEGMLYGIGQKGTVYLLATSPDGFDLVSQFRLPRENRGYSFAHPVVCGGRLYLRYHKNLYVYNIRDETKQ